MTSRSWLATVSLEPMRARDLDAVLAIERVSFPSAWSRASYLRELENPNSHYIVARQDGRIVGYAGMWVISDEAHISTIAVHPSYRRRGLGRRLITHLIEVAVREGAAVVTLEVRESNLAAQSLYRQLGFEATGRLRNYYGDTGENGILMRKRLSSAAEDDAED
jgi:ribosomal-protein-alanine N-acetyltransferase